MIAFVGPSSTEGSLLKGTSDDPSLGPLPLTPEKRLEILQKWQKQQTLYTEETREFILKSGFSRDKQKKDFPSCPSDVEDTDSAQVQQQDTESALVKQQDAVEITKLGTLPAETILNAVKFTKFETVPADTILRQMLIQAQCFPKEYGLRFLTESDFTELENANRHVFQISHRNKVLGTAFLFNLFPEGQQYLLTAGHVIAGYDEDTVLKTEGCFCFPASPVGISSIKDVGVLRFEWPLFSQMYPFLRPLPIDLGTETSTHIYVVGCMSGALSEKCLVLPSQDKDDGFIRFQSKLFSEDSFGSPCLVFKDGQYVVKGMLIGREEGTDTPYELIAITFRCVWKRLGLS